MARLAGLVAGLAALFGAAGAHNGAAADDERLQGTWALTAAEAGGKPAPESFLGQGIRFTFRGDRLVPTGGKGKPPESVFRLDPAKAPKAIDLLPAGDNPGGTGTLRGIYDLQGDRLKLLLVPPRARRNPDGTITAEAAQRPAGFEGKQGLLFLLERVKE